MGKVRMSVEVNMVAVVLATLSSMVVGSIWYAPKVFGNAWMKLSKLDPKKQDRGAAKAIIMTLIVSFVTAYVVAHVAFLSNAFFGNSFLYDSLMTAFWLWLGLTAARFITHDAFERRPARLTMLNITHELVTIVVMGLIIGLMKP
jgi:hypothetical protein